MASLLELSIPKTSTCSLPKTHTVYHVSIQLPLRSYLLQKRYSDFVAFHEAVTSQASAPPPASLPRKSWFTSTTSSPALTEERRIALEAYLQSINESDDDRWRKTGVWRTFLQLPAVVANTSIKTSRQTSITDPTAWLEAYRDLKVHLREARLYLERRDQAMRVQDQHENSAEAKKSLVRASTAILGLEEGLRDVARAEEGTAAVRLGEGELRRRRDLVSTAKKEREGLEALHSSLAGKGASVAFQPAFAPTPAPAAKTGRILGGTAQETDRTRELDNEGVFQLQKQIMDEQDMSVEQLRAVIARQKDIGLAINNELEEQNMVLKMMDEDVDRVDQKVRIAKKRVGKIS